MKYVFISGIPAAGKSHLARKISKTLGVPHIEIDHWRDKLGTDPQLKKWVDFFWNQNETEYWENTTCEQQWKNLKIQSEALWPAILQRIREIEKSEKSAIFEGVNILPHLARQDLNFDGVFLLGESFEKILKRNKQDPRWGKTEELQRKEARAFWDCERVHYSEEARRYGFKTFTDALAAEKELMNILQQ